MLLVLTKIKAMQRLVRAKQQAAGLYACTSKPYKVTILPAVAASSSLRPELRSSGHNSRKNTTATQAACSRADRTVHFLLGPAGTVSLDADTGAKHRALGHVPCLAKHLVLAASK